MRNILNQIINKSKGTKYKYYPRTISHINTCNRIKCANCTLYTGGPCCYYDLTFELSILNIIRAVYER